MRQHRKTTLQATAVSFGLAFLGSMMIAGSPALAEILQFSALGLHKRCPCGVTDDAAEDTAEENNGVLVLKDTAMRYFMPVALPHGRRVCRFTMVYHDINGANSMTARLQQKPIVAGNPPFNPPTTMASVTTAVPVPNTIRKASDSTIVSSQINTTNSFYYIELEAPTFNLNPIGFQIDVRETCPAT
jgi:hypothetical protein